MKDTYRERIKEEQKKLSPQQFFFQKAISGFSSILQMKWQGKDVRLSSALWGQEVGLKPVAEGEWAVFFEGLELGTFDERTGRVRRAKRLREERHEAQLV